MSRDPRDKNKRPPTAMMEKLGLLLLLLPEIPQRQVRLCGVQCTVPHTSLTRRPGPRGKAQTGKIYFRCIAREIPAAFTTL